MYLIDFYILVLLDKNADVKIRRSIINYAPENLFERLTSIIQQVGLSKDVDSIARRVCFSFLQYNNKRKYLRDRRRLEKLAKFVGQYVLRYVLGNVRAAEKEVPGANPEEGGPTA